jgi:protein SCO1
MTLMACTALSSLSKFVADRMKLRFFCGVLFILSFLLGTAHREQAQVAKRTLEPAPAAGAETTYRGGMVSPPLAKPKFTLIDTSGTPFDFSSKTQGYVTLLFFGYTHCPDMCPLQMHLIEQAFKKLPADSADQFKVVFVTTDPERDSPQVLRSWLDHFDKRFIGLTGSDAAIDAAQIAANLSPAKKSAVRPDGAYEVGHAAFLLAYTKDNLAHVIYPAGVQPEDLAHDLPYLAKEQWSSR